MDQNTIALEPFVYKPIVVDNTIKDDISEFSATDFKMTGIKCGCSGKIYRNKYTFHHQHLMTVKHIEWRNSLDIRQTKETACEHCSSLEQKIKSQKIMIGAVDQRNFVLQQKLEEQNKIIADLTTQIIELKENAAQFDEHLANETLELNDLREKNERIENAAQRFMIELGYDIEL